MLLSLLRYSKMTTKLITFLLQIELEVNYVNYITRKWNKKVWLKPHTKSFQKNSSGILITESYLAMILRISNWSSPFFIKVLCKTESELLWQIDVGPTEHMGTWGLVSTNLLYPMHWPYLNQRVDLLRSLHRVISTKPKYMECVNTGTEPELVDLWDIFLLWGF